MVRRGDAGLEVDPAHYGVSAQTRVRWSLTREVFDRLLACLDPDRERAGEKYEVLRRKLVKFFEWERCPFPEDHADEAINRVARRLGEGEAVRDLQGYCFGVARMLLLEILRERERQQKAFESMPPPATAGEEAAESSPPLECLEECLRHLPPETRELITHYYQGEKRARIENRRRMAERLDIPPSALRNRVLRLRDKLEECVERCAKRKLT